MNKISLQSKVREGLVPQGYPLAPSCIRLGRAGCNSLPRSRPYSGPSMAFSFSCRTEHTRAGSMSRSVGTRQRINEGARTTTCFSSTGRMLLSSHDFHPSRSAIYAVSNLAYQQMTRRSIISSKDVQCPLVRFPLWFVTPYKLYLYGGSCERGSSGAIAFIWLLSAPGGRGGGMKFVRSRDFRG
jgi:hypothetical protein